jgi:hypothetical protein
VHEHVHRAVIADHLAAPQAFVDVLAGEHLAVGAREQLDQLVLAPRQAQTAPADERLILVWPDLDLADRDGLEIARLRPATVGGNGLHAGDQLLRVTWLGQPIIGAQP